ncbi:MAG: sigma-54 dependent transcriptional regulator [Ignavibacteriaceae bacterium]|jgi:DNA-binding NtrC family response regulator|nr:sigma-54 dependent transcriptional regulator [Ignavibacteriaceae bacterium]
MNELNILLIDDEFPQLQSLKSFLSKRNMKVFTASDGQKGLDIIRNNAIDIVITDFQMPGLNGLEVLEKAKEINAELDIILISAYGTIERAVDIMKAGAFDYLTKPIDLTELERIINRLRERKYLISENRLLKQKLNENFYSDSIIYKSHLMNEVLSKVSRAAPSKTTILIRGESGTGKELIAKAIHSASTRSEKPFITVNVASLSENLFESELFGHEKGSFTGAINQRIGKFEEAAGGTLFIDEVGDIPLSIQVKLLRLIQFGEIQRIGSNEIINADVRIISATHRNIEQMISDGEFREDLYYRLNVITIDIPPLKKRREDIPLLIDHFIKKYSKLTNKEISGISKEAFDYLIKYSFPGNIRELENIIERGIVLSRSKLLTMEDFPNLDLPSQSNTLLDPLNLEDGYETKMNAYENEMIQEALRRSGGNKSAAARMLGISERHLRSRLERINHKEK